MKLLSLSNHLINLDNNIILNTVVKNRFDSNTKLISSEIKKFSDELLGYLAKHNLLTVTIRRDDGKEKTETFFLKTTIPLIPKVYFTTEYKFFSQENPLFSKNIKIEPWTAKCYYADDGMLIFEDLRIKGYKTRDDKLSLADVFSGLKVIARFHASSIIAQKKLNIPLNNFCPDIFKEKVFVDYGVGWNWIETGMKAIEAIAKKLNYDPSLVRRAYKLTIEKVKPKSNETNVLTHSDLWKNNILFDAYGNGLLVDFQMVTYASIGIDIAMLIYLNTNNEIREKYEKDFMKIYHDELEKTLRHNDLESEVLSIDEVTRAFEDKRICGLVMAVQYLPIELKNEYYADRYFGEDREYYSYTNRTGLILDSMEYDKQYGKIMNDIVHELIKYFND